MGVGSCGQGCLADSCDIENGPKAQSQTLGAGEVLPGSVGRARVRWQGRWRVPQCQAGEPLAKPQTHQTARQRNPAATSFAAEMSWLGGEMTCPGQTVVSHGAGFKPRLGGLHSGLTLPSHHTSRPVLVMENQEYGEPVTSPARVIPPGPLGTGPGHQTPCAGEMSWGPPGRGRRAEKGDF